MAAIEVVRTLPAAPEVVWSWVGDPAGIARWIPAVGSARLDGDIRHLEFADGNPARERIVGHDDARRTYTYTYIDGPLALDRYESTLTVLAAGDGGSEVRWNAEFEAATTELETELAAAIEGIYADALTALAQRIADA